MTLLRALALLSMAAGSLGADAAELSSPLDPARWSIESDEDYANSEDYRAPKPRRGIYAHGFRNLGYIVGAPSPQVISDCEAKGTPIQYPSNYQDQTEIWFVRSGNQALYLSKTYQVETVDNCVAKIRVATDRTRIIIDGDLVHELQADGIGATQKRTDYGVGSFAGSEEALLHPRTGRIPGKRGNRIGNVATRCEDRSAAFVLVEQCWVATTGPAYGMTTRMWVADDAGTEMENFALDDVQNDIMIDGRLFEWDRKIRLLDKD